MKIHSIAILLCLFFLSTSSSFFAQTSVQLPWEYIGGPPANINDVFLQGDSIFVATENGAFYRSPNSNWQEIMAFRGERCTHITAIDSMVFVGFERDSFAFNMAWTKLPVLLIGRSILGTSESDVVLHTSGIIGNFLNNRFLSDFYSIKKLFVYQLFISYYGIYHSSYYSEDLGGTILTQNFDEFSSASYFVAAVKKHAFRGDSIATLAKDSLFIGTSLDISTTNRYEFVGNSTESAGYQPTYFVWEMDTMLVAHGSKHFFKSVDNGHTWELDSFPFVNEKVLNVVHKNGIWSVITDKHVYNSAVLDSSFVVEYEPSFYSKTISKAVRGSNFWCFLTPEGQLFKKTDQTNTNELLNLGLAASKGTLHQLENEFLFLTDKNHYVSSDLQNWAMFEPALSTPYSDFTYSAFQGSLFGSRSYFLSGDEKMDVYRYDSTGVWALVLTEINDTKAIENQQKNTIFYGKWKSQDQGHTWQKDDLLWDNLVFVSNDTLIAGTSGVSLDGGATWKGVQGNYMGNYRFVRPDFVGYTQTLDFGEMYKSYASNQFTGNSGLKLGEWLLFPDDGRFRFLSKNDSVVYLADDNPFSEMVYPDPLKREFGNVITTDSFVYAAYNGGIWRLNTCVLDKLEENPTLQVHICKGQGYDFYGDSLTEKGHYQKTFLDSSNCPYQKAIRLYVNEVRDSWSQKICPGDSVIWNGQVYTEPNVYFQEFKTAEGCDSTVKFWLSYVQQDFNQYQYICAGDTLCVQDTCITTAGQYDFFYTNFLGCDSIVHLKVIDNTDTLSYERTICPGDSVNISGQYFKDVGFYSYWQNWSGWLCPKLIELDLKFLPIDTIYLDTVLTAGASLFGQIVKMDTILQGFFPNPNQACPSVVFANIQVIVPTNEETNEDDFIKIWPQPAQNYVFIQFSKEINANWVLYDSSLKKVKGGKFKEHIFNLDTEGILSGLYWLKILDQDNCVFWRKIVIQL